jgi:hypothetical protein
MESKQAIIKYLENNIDTVKMVRKINSVRDIGDGSVNVSFIYKDNSDVEKSSVESIPVSDLQSELRHIKLEDLLVEPDPVESIIYTDDQLDRLERLRRERDYGKNLTTEQQSKLDKENSFKLGDSITFKDSNPGIVTFVGGINTNGSRKYTIKLQDDVEHRFVLGKHLQKRVVRKPIELSDIPDEDRERFDVQVDKFEKMTTERIIKWKNRKSWDNMYDTMSIEKQAMLYVLQSRGHHTRKKEIPIKYDKNA